jgi:hypothetical protein
MPLDPVVAWGPISAVGWSGRSTPPAPGNGFRRAVRVLDAARRVDGTSQVHQAPIPQGDGAIERRLLAQDSHRDDGRGGG